MYRRSGLGALSPSISSMVSDTAAKYGLDPSLLAAVVAQESGGNPSAVSSAGAQGLMQLMPATASSLGVTNPFDPAQNLDAGARYLSRLLSQFGGDVSLALAAYNAGPGNVNKYGGIPPFPETQNYVSSILQKIGLGSNLAQPGPVGAVATDLSGPGDGVEADLSAVPGEGGLSGWAWAGIGLAVAAVLALAFSR